MTNNCYPNQGYHEKRVNQRSGLEQNLIFLRTRKGIYMGSEVRCKQFIESIYWIARTGAQWREMHDRYGNWNSIFKRFNAWSKKNIWHDLLVFCSQDPDLEYVMIDSTIVRAHACSAGKGQQDFQGLGRSRGRFSTKIHAQTDALGNVRKFIITPGQTNDITQAKRLLEGVFDSVVLADKAYGSEELKREIRKNGNIDNIPSRTNSLNPVKHDKHTYKERHAIECFFGKLKHFRRVFSRFDKTAHNFTAFLSFILWLR